MTNEDLIALRGALVIRTNVQRYPEGYGSPDYDGPTIAPAWRYTLDERPLERLDPPLTRAQFDQKLADAGLDPVTVPADEGDVLSDAEYEAAALAAFRATAILTKEDFINAAADAGIITDAEAEVAASDWPSSFDAALPADPAEARRAKVLWKSASTTHVRRNAPLMQAIIASPLPITEQQVDALFGWNGV